MTTRKFYKTTVTFTVLSEDPIPPNSNIGGIVDECNVGEYVMHSSTINHEVLNGKQAAEELFNAGSEPQFFKIDDEGNEID